MAFEELPPDVEAFFKTGELPASLGAPTPPVTAPPETPPATVATVATPDAPIAVIPDAPAAPASNPFLERLLAEKDQQFADMVRKMTELQAKFDKAQEAPPPDPSIDPLGALTHQMARLQEQMNGFMTKQTEAQTQTQQQQQAQQFFNGVKAQVGEFEKTHPDYQDAYKHLMNTRLQDLKDMGMTSAEIQQTLANEEMTITNKAVAQGKNPAEIVYGMAKRYGFQAPAPAVKPENKLETIKKGMEASTTVDRGTPPEAGKHTVDNLAGVTDAELNSMVSKDWEGLFGIKKGVL